MAFPLVALACGGTEAATTTPPGPVASTGASPTGSGSAGSAPGTEPVGTDPPGTEPGTTAPSTTVAPTTTSTAAITTTVPPTVPPTLPPPPPPAGGIPVPINVGLPPALGHGVPGRRPPPANIDLGGPPAFPGEGEWAPIGPDVDGRPAMYTTTLRAAPGSSTPIGVAWLDPAALTARLHPGTSDPPGAGYISVPFLPREDFPIAAATMNGGFKTTEYPFGFFLEGREAVPMRDGRATFAIDEDGVATIGEWGRDVSIFDKVVSARQNLSLLVDGGHPVGGLNPNDISAWGATLNNVVWVQRSAVGVRADGALVWVGGPLNITSLADLLTIAGAVRGMELDINFSWVAFNWYRMKPDGTLGAYKLAPTLNGDGFRFLSADSRDFFSFVVR